MTITEVLERAPLTNYKGSELTCKAVGDEITRRYGPKIAKQYDPRRNCRTYVGWTFIGFKPRKGEKPIPSVTYIEKKNSLGDVVKTYPRTIYLFFINQVERVS